MFALHPLKPLHSSKLAHAAASSSSEGLRTFTWLHLTHLEPPLPRSVRVFEVNPRSSGTSGQNTAPAGEPPADSHRGRPLSLFQRLCSTSWVSNNICACRFLSGWRCSSGCRFLLMWEVERDGGESLQAAVGLSPPWPPGIHISLCSDKVY